MSTFPRFPSPLSVPLLLGSLLVLGGCSLSRPGGAEVRATPRSSGDVLTAEQIEKYPAASTVEELLEQHFSGLYIRRRHNNPGASGDVYMLGNRSPLFVVDGIPQQPTGSLGLNPRDIESIELVKFAGASLYGFRGGSGVILITTKK